MSELDAFQTRFAATYRLYLDEAPTEVDAAEVARAVAAHPRTRWTWPWLLRPAPALLWGGLVALLLVAVAAALVVGALLQSLRGVSLTPTGIEVLTPDTGAYSQLVADREGMLWARGDGLVVRFDPSEGSARTWTVSDDVAFETSDLVPARAGGVWLVSGRMLRLFDGAAFRQVIEAPADVETMAEAPDGSAWLLTADGAVLHWTGSSWADARRPNPYAVTSAMATDSAGGLWIGWMGSMVARYDGSAWREFDYLDAPPLAGGVEAIAGLPDGGVLVATNRGFTRFDGSAWTVLPPFFEATDPSLAVGPDGAIWVAGGRVGSQAIVVGRFDGRSWASYGLAEGLPDDTSDAWLTPTAEGLYVGTGNGIFRLANDRWERAWPPASSPGALKVLLAVSHDELFAMDAYLPALGTRLWHLENGAWSRETPYPDRPTMVPEVLVLSPDGTVWAAGAGVAYLRDGHWTLVDSEAAGGIAFDAEGTVWVAGTTGPDDSERPELWTLRFDGATWTRRTIEPGPSEPGVGGSLALDASGNPWMTVGFGWGAFRLEHFDGQARTSALEIAGSSVGPVLGSDRNGGVWVAVITKDSGEASWSQFGAARFDGQGWTVVDPPADALPDLPLLAADGTLWTSTRRGAARYDGTRWTIPYAGIASAGSMVQAVAPDGTVFGAIGSTVLRFPAPAAQPD